MCLSQRSCLHVTFAYRPTLAYETASLHETPYSEEWVECCPFFQVFGDCDQRGTQIRWARAMILMWALLTGQVSAHWYNSQAGWAWADLTVKADTGWWVQWEGAWTQRLLVSGRQRWAPCGTDNIISYLLTGTIPSPTFERACPLCWFTSIPSITTKFLLGVRCSTRPWT